MNDLFISISTAIEQIDTAVTAKGNKGIIGYVLRKCKLFNLPLYQIDQETNQIKQVHSIISEPIYEYFKEKYPPKPRDTVSNILELAKPFTYTSESFKLSEYFWRIDEFKNRTHEIFDIADIPAISYQVSQDVQELQAQIQNLQQQLKEKDEQVQALTNQLQENQVNLWVFDNNHKYFAPDLAYAVKLWIDTYGNGKKKNDSHTNLANTWIEKNTRYDECAEGYGQTKDRIREITTPLKDFGAKRLREK